MQKVKNHWPVANIRVSFDSLNWFSCDPKNPRKPKLWKLKEKNEETAAREAVKLVSSDEKMYHYLKANDKINFGYKTDDSVLNITVSLPGKEWLPQPIAKKNKVRGRLAVLKPVAETIAGGVVGAALGMAGERLKNKRSPELLKEENEKKAFFEDIVKQLEIEADQIEEAQQSSYDGCVEFYLKMKTEGVFDNAADLSKLSKHFNEAELTSNVWYIITKTMFLIVEIMYRLVPENLRDCVTSFESCRTSLLDCQKNRTSELTEYHNSERRFRQYIKQATKALEEKSEERLMELRETTNNPSLTHEEVEQQVKHVLGQHTNI